MEIPEVHLNLSWQWLYYKVNGVDTEFSEDDLMNLLMRASLSTEKRIMLKDTYPPIHDFTMVKNDSDFKDELLART
jgi:hypothetical protein